MSELTITHNGIAQTAKTGSDKKGGKLVRTQVVSSATAFSNGDVMCLSTEIPNATRIKGGVSKLVAVTVIDLSGTVDESAGSFRFFLSENQANMISAISPSSSGGVNMDDAAVSAAKFIGAGHFSDTNMDFEIGSGASLTMMGTTDENHERMPMLVQSAENSTSIWFSLVAADAVDLAGANDLTLVWHFEYLD